MIVSLLPTAAADVSIGLPSAGLLVSLALTHYSAVLDRRSRFAVRTGSPAVAAH